MMSGTAAGEKKNDTGPVTLWLRRVTLVAAAAVTVWVLVRYPSAPDTVPVHFAAGGEADEWGSKSTVLWLSLIMLVMIGGIHWLSYRPDAPWVNYPKPLTVVNAPAMYRAGEQMMVWLNAGLVVLYAGLAGAVLSGADILLFLIPGFVLLGGGLVVGIVKMVRA
ncbi:MAG TPA: hypothetical protein DIW82_00105 [Corynebacterium nuruki]|jgi:hypothetical protein|uniref:DUF1648 domain-containing protein n=2 Tax=Corynebacterium nuruki TaxID=1032851 RepID=A0A3D4SXK7_9CORY|nr:hypothetical protein [Corynebacterium nuruki]